MKFWIFSLGRTGSVRLTKMLSNGNHQHYGITSKVWGDPDSEEHFVYHVHDTNRIPPDDAVKILSTRKNKKGIVCSRIVGLRLGDVWVPSLQKVLELSPFHVDEKEYKELYLEILESEQAYIDKYNPIQIYLEDSIEDIERKLGVSLPYKEHDTSSISMFPPKQFITNYDELQEFI